MIKILITIGIPNTKFPNSPMPKVQSEEDLNLSLNLLLNLNFKQTLIHIKNIELIFMYRDICNT